MFPTWLLDVCPTKQGISILPRHGNYFTLFGNRDTMESVFFGPGCRVLGMLTGLGSFTSCNIWDLISSLVYGKSQKPNAQAISLGVICSHCSFPKFFKPSHNEFLGFMTSLFPMPNSSKLAYYGSMCSHPYYDFYWSSVQ